MDKIIINVFLNYIWLILEIYQGNLQRKIIKKYFSAEDSHTPTCLTVSWLFT